MNPRFWTGLLATSAAILAVVLVLGQRRGGVPTDNSTGSASPDSPLAASGKPSPGVARKAPDAFATDFRWERVLTNDLHVYIRNLRAIACPENTVRDIIVAEVNRRFAPREAPFRDPGTGDIAAPGETTAQRRIRRKADYQRRRNLRLVEKEKSAVILDLLGYEIPLEPLKGWYSRNYERMESAINGVPAEKRERVREVMEAYWELSDTLNDESDVSNKGRDAAFAERYRENNERRRLGLAQVLTPDELELFDMRASSVAERLRNQLGAMQPTEAEFREIYRLRRDIEEPFGGTMTLGDTSGIEADPEAETRYRQRVESLLPPERLAQFDRVQDPRFQNLQQLRERFGLDEAVVDQAYGLLSQAQPVKVQTQVYENGRIVEREVTVGAGRPPAEQWNQMRTILGNQAFQVLEAMLPDAQGTESLNLPVRIRQP